LESVLPKITCNARPGAAKPPAMLEADAVSVAPVSLAEDDAGSTAGALAATVSISMGSGAAGGGGGVSDSAGSKAIASLLVSARAGGAAGATGVGSAAAMDVSAVVYVVKKSAGSGTGGGTVPATDNVDVDTDSETASVGGAVRIGSLTIILGPKYVDCGALWLGISSFMAPPAYPGMVAGPYPPSSSTDRSTVIGVDCENAGAPIPNPVNRKTAEEVVHNRRMNDFLRYVFIMPKILPLHFRVYLLMRIVSHLRERPQGICQSTGPKMNIPKPARRHNWFDYPKEQRRDIR
jgi:hypothetical protein